VVAVLGLLCTACPSTCTESCAELHGMSGFYCEHRHRIYCFYTFPNSRMQV